MKDTLGRENRKLADRYCHECGKQFRPLRKSSKYCSRQCAWKNNGGHNKKQESWWINSKGYIEGRVTINGKKVYKKLHRWIMEQHLGHPISKDYDVHHINGDKQDNRIENLQLIKHGKHTTVTNNNKLYKKGYKLCLTKEERKKRSDRAKKLNLNKLGNIARYAK
jgi:hypothetical protein